MKKQKKLKINLGNVKEKSEKKIHIWREEKRGFKGN